MEESQNAYDLWASPIHTSHPTSIPQHTHSYVFGQLSDDMKTSLVDICPWINGHRISFTIKDKLPDSCIENHSILLNTDDA